MNCNVERWWREVAEGPVVGRGYNELLPDPWLTWEDAQVSVASEHEHLGSRLTDLYWSPDGSEAAHPCPSHRHIGILI